MHESITIIIACNLAHCIMIIIADCLLHIIVAVIVGERAGGVTDKRVVRDGVEANDRGA